MKILNIITLSTLTILPIVGCSKKENETQQVQYKIYDLKFSEINNSYLQSLYKKGSDPVYINIDSVKEQLPLEIKNYGENTRGLLSLPMNQYLKKLKKFIIIKKKTAPQKKENFLIKIFKKKILNIFILLKKLKM
ncbi:hypothetical protein [Spiroplasma endosymbiont of Nephrotoma flavescens]|uniref:hypothetical protein n=1 Tax=Spiroplasma endosymbiont of Nephrotoma flavescens TaxID=3066302 RepID=UPI00313C906F